MRTKVLNCFINILTYIDKLYILAPVTATSSNAGTKNDSSDPAESEDLIVDGDEPEESNNFNVSETVVVIASTGDGSCKEQK